MHTLVLYYYFDVAILHVQYYMYVTWIMFIVMSRKYSVQRLINCFTVSD